MKVSGWCSPSPCHSPRGHRICQERLDKGLLDRCECAGHDHPTQRPEPTARNAENAQAARVMLHGTKEDADA